MSKKTTRRAMLASVVALALCFTMLIGTTYAWFTDSVTSANNIIKSGTLDIDFKWADGTEAPANAQWEDASTGAIFNYDLWEPGYVQVRHVKVENIGTLALKYQFAIQVNGELATNAYGHTLADAIDVYYVDPAMQVADRAALVDNYKLGSLTDVLANLNATGSGVLYPEGKGHNLDTVTIALKMREDAGNEYQNMAVGTSFSVQLLATQYTYERDSFDDQYDATADGTPDNPVFPVIAPSTASEFDDALAAAQDGDVIDFSGNNAVVVANTTVDADVTIQNANFDTSNSTANVALYNVDFKGDVTFKDCDFESDLGILSNKFEGKVVFDSCEMHGTGYCMYNNAAFGDVTFKNCKMKSDWCYTVNFQNGAGQNTIRFENCDLTGWLSFGAADCGKLEFVDCVFGDPATVDYSDIRIYQDAEFVNCDFTAYAGKPAADYPGIEACADNITITLTNCTGDIQNLIGINGTSFTNVTFVVDGQTVTP